MFRSRRNRGEHRYYLLPGMGRSNRRYRRRTHVVAVFVGVFVSLLFAALLYWMNQR